MIPLNGSIDINEDVFEHVICLDFIDVTDLELEVGSLLQLN